MSKSTKPVGGFINTMSKLGDAVADVRKEIKEAKAKGLEAPRLPVSRGDGWSVDPLLLIEEEGFNSRGAFATDYWNRPDVVAHIRGFADSYKAGSYVPPMVVIVRDADIIIRQGAHRLRGLKLAIAEGAKIELVSVIEQKGDEAEQTKLCLNDNNSRHLAPLDRAVHYGKLSNWGWPVSRIAKEIGMTAEHVRTTLVLLELPIDLKRMIADDVIRATLALELFNDHGHKALEYVNKAIAEKEVASALAQEAGSLELKLEGTSDVENPVATELNGAASAGEAQPQQKSKEAIQKLKITGKDLKKVVGTTPKISKKTVNFVHKSFEALSKSIDQITIQGDRFVMEMSAEEFEMLKEMKAQLIAVTKPDPDEKDPAQTDLLDGQTDPETGAGQTLQ